MRQRKSDNTAQEQEVLVVRLDHVATSHRLMAVVATRWPTQDEVLHDSYDDADQLSNSSLNLRNCRIANRNPLIAEPQQFTDQNRTL